MCMYRGPTMYSMQLTGKITLMIQMIHPVIPTSKLCLSPVVIIIVKKIVKNILSVAMNING